MKVGGLTLLAETTSTVPTTRLYHSSHNKLFAAKEANKFMWTVILAHLKDLQINFTRYILHNPLSRTVYLYSQNQQIITVQTDSKSWRRNFVETRKEKYFRF